MNEENQHEEEHVFKEKLITHILQLELFLREYLSRFENSSIYVSKKEENLIHDTYWQLVKTHKYINKDTK